jgi:hypothetical protein
MSGGVGLADIEPFLNPKDWTDNDLEAEVNAHFEKETPTDGSRVVVFNVEHHGGFILSQTWP